MTRNVLLKALYHAKLSITSSYILMISGDQFYGRVHRRLRSLGYNSFIVVPNNARIVYFDEEMRYIWSSDALFMGQAAMTETVQEYE